MLATVTHDNLPGLQQVVGSLVRQSGDLDAEVLVVANAPRQDTMDWLDHQGSAISVVRLPSNIGPGAGRNVVFAERPSADAYVFVDDDVIIAGEEVKALLEILGSGEFVGVASGVPIAASGEPLARGFRWRPLGRAFPDMWDRWWGSSSASGPSNLEDADRVSASVIAVRGSAARASGGFDPIFWPGCHEDTDFCARVRFAGYRIVVDPALPIRQEVSVTTRKVLGSRHLSLCRATGILYAALDYPVPLAVGRLAEAATRSVIGPGDIRRSDAEGLIRCAKDWRHILRRRKENREARARREVMASSGGHRSQFAYPHGFGGRLVGEFLAVANAWMADEAIQLLELDPDSKVLEVGFGPGVAIRRICRELPEARVSGVDPSQVMLRQALRRNRSAVRTGQADLRLGSAASLPWPNATFDRVLALNNAHLWDPADRGFSECRRVLRPGGKILVGFHIWRTRGRRTGRLGSLENAQGFLEEHLTASGFVHLEVFPRTFLMGAAALLVGTRP